MLDAGRSISALRSAGVHDGTIKKVLKLLNADDVKTRVLKAADFASKMVVFLNAFYEALESAKSSDEVIAEWFEEIQKAAVNTIPPATAHPVINGEDPRRRN